MIYHSSTLYFPSPSLPLTTSLLTPLQSSVLTSLLTHSSSLPFPKRRYSPIFLSPSYPLIASCTSSLYSLLFLPHSSSVRQLGRRWPAGQYTKVETLESRVRRRLETGNFFCYREVAEDLPHTANTEHRGVVWAAISVLKISCLRLHGLELTITASMN